MLRALNQRYSPSAPSEAILGFVRAAGLTRLLPDRQCLIPVSRVKRGGPAVAQRRVQRHPRVVQEALAHVVAAAVGQVGVQHLGHGLRQGAVAKLAFPQRELGPLSLQLGACAAREDAEQGQILRLGQERTIVDQRDMSHHHTRGPQQGDAQIALGVEGRQVAILGEPRLDPVRMMAGLPRDDRLARRAGQRVAHVLAEGAVLPEGQGRHPVPIRPRHFGEQRVSAAERFGREPGHRSEEIQAGQRRRPLADGPEGGFHPCPIGDLALEPQIELGVLDGDGRLGCHDLDQREALGCEGAGREVVLQVDDAEEAALVHQRRRYDRAGLVAEHVRVVTVPVVAPSVGEHQAFERAANVVHQDHRQRLRAGQRRSRVHLDHDLLPRALGMHPRRVVVLQDQRTALGTRILDRDGQQLLQQPLQLDLAGEDPGGLHDRDEVETVATDERRGVRCGRGGRNRRGAEAAVEVGDLGGGPPAGVGASGGGEKHGGHPWLGPLEPEPGAELVRQTLVLERARTLRVRDGLLVQIQRRQRDAPSRARARPTAAATGRGSSPGNYPPGSREGLGPPPSGLAGRIAPPARPPRSWRRG